MLRPEPWNKWIGSFLVPFFVSLSVTGTTSTESFPFDPAETEITLMGRAAQVGDHVLFSYLVGTEPHLVALDLSSSNAKRVSEGRMTFFLPFILPADDEFLVIPAAFTNAVYVLDTDGALQRTLELSSLDGWIHGAKIIYIAPFDERLLMATLLQPETNSSSLVILDLEAGTAETWTESQARQGFKQYWLPLGSNLLWVTQETGAISKISTKDFIVTDEIRPPSPLIENPRARPGRNPYRGLLSQPRPFEDGYCFKLLTETSTGGLSVSSLIVDERGSSPRETYPIGTLGDTALVFDWNRMSLAYVPRK